MARIGFLHTAQVHVDTFTQLVSVLSDSEPRANTLESHHVVRPDLLAYAREHGVDEHLTAELSSALGELADADADVIVCTCSTISGLAERPAERGAVEVIRIDRPMAAQAVARAAEATSGSPSGAIVVVTAVESAAAPGIQLLQEEAERQGSTPRIEHLFCEGAWAHFEAGDIDAFLDAVAAAIDQIDPDVNVVVIAQASMAGATERVAHPARVLTSPGLAVSEAFRQIETP